MAPSVARPRFAAALVAAYAVLLALQGIGYATGVGQARAVDQHVVALCNGFGADTLPTAVGPWRRDPQKSFAARDVPEMMYADHSRSWQFQRGGRTATVSFDYPYFEWHDLAVCYKGTGWTIGERSVFGHALPDQGTELSCTKFTMSRPYERHGYVWFCSFDERGAPVVESNLAEERWSERLGSLKAGLLRLVGSGGLAPSARPQILQVQVVHDTYVPLTEADEKDVQELFLTASGLLRKKFVASLSTLTASR